MLDIIVPQWLDEPERAEAVSVAAEERNLKIARETGQHCLPTSSFDWEDIFVSGHPHGALPVPLARETLTRKANRRRWAAQKARRSGRDALARAIMAA
ncbi:hypothetical protein [Humibacter sp.]|uniref:hypothetical protein n=1 Tax=Humibacter sp. TaxID=1940291 RepID=UPI003F7F1221